MDDEMLEEDADLIDQVSDDDDGQAMDEDGIGKRENNNNNNNANNRNNQNRPRRNRLADQVNIDDEPPLHGYER